jgi:hypothetical protein
VSDLGVSHRVATILDAIEPVAVVPFSRFVKRVVAAFLGGLPGGISIPRKAHFSELEKR